MKTTVGRLRSLFSEAFREARVSASEEFLKKEDVRQALQDIVVAAVSSGEVSNDAQLSNMFNDVDAALKALKMIPIEVWQKMASRAV